MRSRIAAPKTNGKTAGKAEGASPAAARVPRAAARAPLCGTGGPTFQTGCDCDKDEDEKSGSAASGSGSAFRGSTGCDCGQDDEKSGATAGSGRPLKDDPAAILRRLGPGHALDHSVRKRMEQAFRSDFRHVRVHTDTPAAALASQLGANAFTVDQHIAFASGRYHPGTRLGDALLAHELAHTIQQRGPGEATPASTQGLNTALENDANSSTRRALRSLWGARNSGSSEDAAPSMRTGTRLSLAGCGSSPTPTDCSVTGQFTTIPSGNLTPTWMASENLFAAPFNMEATFAPAGAGCDCHRGEYRQYVKGYLKVAGTKLKHQLHERELDSSYQEDYWKQGGTWYHYGYRNQQFATSKFDNPDQATGCNFHGYDLPRVRGSSGDALEINLGFKAELIDTQNPGRPLASQEWTVNGTGTQP